jgi:hypothetical protein
MMEASRLTSSSSKMEPIDETDPSSPWAPERKEFEVRLRTQHQPIHYRWGRGFETRGVDGLLFCEVISAAPAGGRRLIRIRSRPQEGRNTAHLRPETAVVEPTLVWPLIKGSHVQPWKVLDAGLYCIVAHDPDDLATVLTTDEMIASNPRLYDYLEPHLPMLEGRSLYRSGDAGPRGPWGLSGPLHHLEPDSHVVMVRYIASAGRPAAAVTSPRLDAKLGRATIALPNNKVNVYFTDKEDEAWFIAGWLNSAPVQDSLERFSAATGVTPKALERIPIPTYDSTEEHHRDVVALARACAADASVDNRVSLVRHWNELDQAVATLAGICPRP